MRKIKVPLLAKLFVAIVLGIGFGMVAPGWCIRASNSLGFVFGQYIKFMVPFIIIGFVTSAIADTGRSAGRMLLLTMAIAWCSTVLFGYFALGTSKVVFPAILEGGISGSSAVANFPPYFKLPIPPIADVTTSLVVAFIVGFGVVATGSELVGRLTGEFRGIVEVAVKNALVPFLPAYVFTVIADIAASGKLAAVGGACWKIMLLATLTTTAVLLIQFTIAGVLTGRNPLKALWTMMPAYLTGWGCCSSAATIPYTLAQTKKNGVSDETAGLVIPLCSNVHMAGSMANMVVYAAGLMVLAGEPLSVGAFTEYILMISVIAVASPGVPGGIVLASSAVAESALGFSPERYAVMIALYMALDGMGTACNLTGDCAIAMLVDRFGRRSRAGASSRS